MTSPSGARRLVLSSRRVPADLRVHARGCRALLVANAADHYGHLGRRDKVARDTHGLQRAGFRVETLDLRAVRDGALGAGDLAERCDLVWVGGGNTFWLAYQLARSGLAAEVGALLDAGVVWGGESAGAVVCAPSLAGVETHDDPSLSPDRQVGGLGLVPFLPWAHWSPRHPDHRTRHQPLPGVATPMYRIRDGEHLVVVGDDVRRVGPQASPRVVQEALF